MTRGEENREGMMRMRKTRTITWLAVLGASGICFQAVGCLGGAAQFLRNANPCGTVLDCDPLAYRFLTSGYEGPGVNPVIDPACTFPPFCAGDPFIGDLGGG